jgi:hypothetical protein
MKNFMAVYTGNPQSMAAWKALAPDERARREQEGLAAWMQWGERNRDAIVDNGGPLGKTRRVTRSGISSIANHLAGYTVVRAESQEAAAKLFEEHPHFTLFPGDGVEVMEVLPIPSG